jgi:predicted small secreted protein
MKLIKFSIISAALALLASSCSTMQGLGNDVQKAGSALSNTAERAAAE